MPLFPAQPRRRMRGGSLDRRSWTRVGTAATGLMVVGLMLGSVVRGFAGVPFGWVEIARDSFDREVTDGWGSAPAGGAYAISGSAEAVRVANGSGVVKLSSGRSFVATLPAVSSADVDISDTAMVAGATEYDVMHGWGARLQKDGSGYIARVRFSDNGRSTLGLSRVNGGNVTWLSGMPLPTNLRTGQAFHGALQVTGTSPVTLLLRVWVAGETKPRWQLSYADDSPERITARGAVALRSFVLRSNGPLSVIRDDVSAGGSGLGRPLPAPIPGPNPTLAPTPSTAPRPTPSATTKAPAPSPTVTATKSPSPTPTPTPTLTTPPPTPTPPTPPTQSGSRGSVPVGSANYAVPAGAIFVDGGSGDNSNDGSQGGPLKTIQAAVDKAGSGKTIVVRAGVYHESVKSGKTITLQNYPGEAVWLDGSVPLTTWSKSGSVWVATGWKAEFSGTMGADSGFKARFIGPNPMAADPDQLFYGGKGLKQVGSAGEVGPGEFHVSDGSDTITLGSDPNGNEVRASDLDQALHSWGPNSVVQGLGFRRYANAYEQGGGIRLNDTGGIIRDVVVEDMATSGITMSNGNKVVDHVTVRRSGQLGIGGHKNNNSVVSNSIFTGNNIEHFKDEPVSGGMKFTTARTVTVRNVEANNNRGTGIWFDESSYDLTIVNNTANGNTKHGIEVEISAKGIIANNQAINGGEDGIILFDSGEFKVFNNEVGGSSLFGIKLAQDDRRSGDAAIPFLTRDIQLSNNVFGNGGYFQLYALDGRTRRAVDGWNVTVTGNLFNKRAVKADPTMVAWGKGDNSTLERYETPSALAAAKNGGWQNAQIDSSKSINAMDGDKSAHSSVAVAVPRDVAAATGGRLAAGSKVLGVR